MHIAEKVTRRVISWLSLKEVKTPLSFYFRVCLYLVVMLIFIIVWGPPSLTAPAFIACVCLMGVIVILVSLFAWFKPKNLVYGETGHRAEWKATLGTESHELAHGEIETLPGVPNPRYLGSNQRPRERDA